MYGQEGMGAQETDDGGTGAEGQALENGSTCVEGTQQPKGRGR